MNDGDKIGTCRAQATRCNVVTLVARSREAAGANGLLHATTEEKRKKKTKQNNEIEQPPVWR